MSTAPIRHGSTAHAAAAQRTEHDPKHASNHGHHASTGHGHFGGYVFRHGRNPAPPVPRRPVPLRARQKSRTAQNGAAEHETEQYDPLLTVSARTDALEDDPETQAANTDGMPDDTSHNGAGQRKARPLPQVRMRPEPTRSAQTLESLLEQLCGSPAQALCRNGGTHTMAEHAHALLNILLAIASPAVGSGGMGLSSEALQLTAVRAYLQRNRERGAFTTLERVKQMLVETTAAGRTQNARATPVTEKEQDRHLLLPLTLLNADQPRTHEQRDQACDRMELLSASRHMQRARE